MRGDAGAPGALFRLRNSAEQKRRKDRVLGLEPSFSFIAYRVTWKLFCERCASCNSPDDLTIDHHWPAAEGVPIEPGNAVLLCRACNASKGVRSPKEFYSPHRLAAIERTLRMAAEFTFLIEALLPEFRPRRIRGRVA
ncbi:MAG: HNH endonuclease [Myxococcales bacterium]|nr:HNH endonuclease [Myxococcales bacterium]